MWRIIFDDMVNMEGNVKENANKNIVILSFSRGK